MTNTANKFAKIYLLVVKYVVDSCIQCGLCHVQCQINNNLMTMFDVWYQSTTMQIDQISVCPTHGQ